MKKFATQLKAGVQNLSSRIFGFDTTRKASNKAKKSGKVTPWSRGLTGAEQRRAIHARGKIIRVGPQPMFSREDRAQRKFGEAQMSQLVKWQRRLARACKRFARKSDATDDRDRKALYNTASSRAARLSDLAFVEIFSRQYKEA